MKRYSLLPAVLLLLTACDPKSDRAAPLPKMVKVAEVVKAGNAQQRVFPARIESGDATDLAFKRAGQIETRTFAGVVVKQGQRLASLNDREARQRLNDRQTAATGSAAIRPLPDLAGRRAVSKAEMDVQRANRDSANAALQIAREELSQMTLVAPLAGQRPAYMCEIIRSSQPASPSSH